jgi:hypothetical protein
MREQTELTIIDVRSAELRARRLDSGSIHVGDINELQLDAGRKSFSIAIVRTTPALRLRRYD